MEEVVILEKYGPLFDPEPETRYFVITGGRGSGKSWSVALSLMNQTDYENEIILFTRWTLTSAFISIIPEFIQKIELMKRESDFDITQSEIINKKTGSKILFRGIKTSQGTATANLKSIAGVTTFVLDEAEELADENVFDRIDLSVRSVLRPNRVILLMNPSYKSHWVYKKYIANKRKDTTYIETTYLDNEENLSQSFLDQAEQVKKSNISRYNHLFIGDWLEDAEGLLWNRNMIDRCRISEKPELVRIVVSIDPAVTASLESDETGITVLGKDSQGRGYLLEDLSGKYSPNEWSKIATQAVTNWNADCIVAEKNQGGDMVESMIRQHDKVTRVILVTATKGKYVRAEPVYSMYEQNKVFHVGTFPILERQMISFDPEKGKSPDRVDALVWGFTELLMKKELNFAVWID